MTKINLIFKVKFTFTKNHDFEESNCEIIKSNYEDLFYLCKNKFFVDKSI